MMKRVQLSLLGVLATLTGCASILAPGPDVVPIGSMPQGAKVYLDDNPVGTTPCQVTFSRSCEGVLRFELPGYRSLVRDQDKVVNGWFIGDIVLGSTLGIVIDLVSHNQGKYSTDPIQVQLDPMGTQ